MKKKSKKNKSFFSKLPGFRSGNKIKKIIAVVGYAFIILMAWAFASTAKQTLPVMIFLFGSLAFVALMFNYENIQAKIPGFSIKSPLKKAAVYSGYGLAIFLLTFLMFGASLPKDKFKIAQEEAANKKTEQVKVEEPKKEEKREEPKQEEGKVESKAEEKKVAGESIETFLVTYVVDGDTLELSNKERVRLIGIDTPERDRPYFQEATDKLKELTLNKQVKLEKDVSERDKYGRLLRFIYVGDTFVNLELVRQGYAKVYTYPPDVKFADQFKKAEQEAREKGIGLWGISSPIPQAQSIFQPRPAPQPSPQPASQPAPTSQNPPSSGFALPSCASSDCDCSDFGTHAYAQWFFDNYDRANKHRLDGSDHDGIACEALP